MLHLLALNPANRTNRFLQRTPPTIRRDISANASTTTLYNKYRRCSAIKTSTQLTASRTALEAHHPRILTPDWTHLPLPRKAYPIITHYQDRSCGPASPVWRLRPHPQSRSDLTMSRRQEKTVPPRWADACADARG